jgi:hypothetical protein
MLVYSPLERFIDNANDTVRDQCEYWLSLLDPFWQGYAKMLFDNLKATKIKNMGDVSYAELALKLASYMQEKQLEN